MDYILVGLLVVFWVLLMLRYGCGCGAARSGSACDWEIKKKQDPEA